MSNPPIVASIVTSMPGGGSTKIVLPYSLEWDDSLIELFALSMRTQGNWFMGRECRTIEQSMKVTRDLFTLCEIMVCYPPYPKNDGPLVPGWIPSASAVVSGTPGHWLPEGCKIPQEFSDTQYHHYGESIPWAEGLYVLLGDGSKVTYVNDTATCYGWARPWKKSAAEVGMQFPEEPTITANDPANAAKLAGLGYIPKVTTDWQDPMMVGNYYFIWRYGAWTV